MCSKWNIKGLFSPAMWKDSCCPKRQSKRCCFCFTHYWVPVALFPLLLALEALIANHHGMYESVALPAILVLWYIVLLCYPRAQCTRLALFITLVVTTTLSWTAWCTRLGLLLYEEGLALFGVCLAESELFYVIVDIFQDVDKFVKRDGLRALQGLRDRLQNLGGDDAGGGGLGSFLDGLSDSLGDISVEDGSLLDTGFEGLDNLGGLLQQVGDSDLTDSLTAIMNTNPEMLKTGLEST